MGICFSKGCWRRGRDGERDVDTVYIHRTAPPAIPRQRLHGWSDVPSQNPTNVRMQCQGSNTTTQIVTETSVQVPGQSKVTAQNTTDTGKVTGQGQGQGHRQSDTATVKTLYHLWDRRNPEQQEIVRLSTGKKDLLKSKLVDLALCVDPAPLWAHLKQLDVLSDETKDSICLNATRHQIVEGLIAYLERSPLWKLHGFLRALAKTNQDHVIDLLELSPEDYHDTPEQLSSPSSRTSVEKQHYYRNFESGRMLTISRDLLQGILQHSGSYNKTLMKTILFGFKDNIPIDLTNLYVCTDADCKRNERELKRITKFELFLRLFQEHPPNCLSMEGPAGAGKSSYLGAYAHDWSTSMTACHAQGPHVSCKGHRWKLVIYIPAGSITGSVQDAIRANLKCDPKYKDLMMAAIATDGDGVLLITDGLDELRNLDSISSFTTFTQICQEMTGQPKLLISARNGLLPIDGKFFDRFITLEGFSVHEGMEYVVKYFAERYGLVDHLVLDYVSEHQQQLEWVLTNPLRTHIFSELTASGSLTLEDVRTLTTIKLLKSLEVLVVRRDEMCRAAETPVEHSAHFYEVCLKCLLNDERKIKEEDISDKSPYLTFLRRFTYTDEDFNECSNYGFSHEVLFEFFAVQGFIQCLKHNLQCKTAIMLYLCMNPNMWNVLELTCGFIAQYEPTLIADVLSIIQACLILQSGTQWAAKTEFTEELFQLPNLVEAAFQPDILANGLTAEQAMVMKGVHETIQVAFSEQAEHLREVGWFLNGYKDTFPESEFHAFIAKCLRQYTTFQKEEICSQSTHCLLPCALYELSIDASRLHHYYVVPVDGTRWATMKEDVGKGWTVQDVDVWCPSDVSSTLNTCKALRAYATPNQPGLLRIHLDRLVRLWGARSPDVWSQEEWTPALKALLAPDRGITGLTVDNLGSAPLEGLLAAAAETITPGHTLTDGMWIWEGKVSEDDLMSFAIFSKSVDLKLDFWHSTIVLRKGHHQDDVPSVDERLRFIEQGCRGKRGDLYIPTYETHDGLIVCEEYNPSLRR